MIGLDVAERRGRATIPDQRALAVAPTIAEPLRQYLLFRDFIGPDRRRHIIHVAGSYPQPPVRSVVRDCIGHMFGIGGDRAAGGNARPALGEPRRTGGTARRAIDETLAECVQPDD